MLDLTENMLRKKTKRNNRWICSCRRELLSNTRKVVISKFAARKCTLLKIYLVTYFSDFPVDLLFGFQFWCRNLGKHERQRRPTNVSNNLSCIQFSLNGCLFLQNSNLLPVVTSLPKFVFVDLLAPQRDSV